jgi:predicted esterase
MLWQISVICCRCSQIEEHQSKMENDQAITEEDRVFRAEINLYYDLHIPEVKPAPMLIALHGYGANKRQMMREAKQLVPEGFAIASPQGFYQHIRDPKEPGGPLRFGFGWLTNFRAEESVVLHHKFLLDLINLSVARKVVDPSKIFLLGFSQSCALNYRFAFSHPDQLKGVIGICGGVPGDWESSQRYRSTKAQVFHLAGTRDEFYPPSRVEPFSEQLRMRAENVDFKSYDAGHEIVPEMRHDVRAWLEQNCRRA